MQSPVKHEYNACDETNCEAVKLDKVPAQIEAANHALRDDSKCDRLAENAAANTIPKPDKAEKNLTENTLQPKNFKPSEINHHEPKDLPEIKFSPILGIK